MTAGQREVEADALAREDDVGRSRALIYMATPSIVTLTDSPTSEKRMTAALQQRPKKITWGEAAEIIGARARQASEEKREPAQRRGCCYSSMEENICGLVTSAGLI